MPASSHRRLNLLFIVLVIGCGCAPFGAGAADPVALLEMDEIVVTGTHEDVLWNEPRSTSIITQDDIRRATSTNLVDLLAKEANVNVRSFFGNDKFAGVDIRGQGQSSASNVLVLIDGVRINEPDLSGADYSSIPLDQIERIEVVRGANTVRYGDGAVGGVINIITRRANEQWRARTTTTIGSFDSYGAKLDVAGYHGPLGLSITASAQDADGYRDNGDFYEKDGALELSYAGANWLETYVRASIHSDRYGIPGPVPAVAFERSAAARKQSLAPNDTGSTVDRRYRAGLRLDLGRYGELDALARYRNRTNSFVIGFSPLLTVPEQENTIESVTRNYNATYTLPLALFTGTQQLLLGFESYAADYERRENGRIFAGRSQSRIGRIKDYAGFVSAEWALPWGVTTTVGYRKDAFDISRRDQALEEVCDTELVTTTTTTTVFMEIAPGVIVPVEVPITVTLPVLGNCRVGLRVTPGQAETWRNDAYEAGLTFSPRDWLNLWLSFSRSFRNPNVDELTLATTALRPQTAAHWDGGVRVRADSRLEASLSLFHMQVEDEIFFGFDVDLGREINRNLDEVTRRTGAELEIKYRWRDNLSGWLNASYINPRLADSGPFIPLVPREQISAGVEWSPISGLSLAASVNHIGARFDGSDFDNRQFEEIDAYQVVDAKIRWSSPRFTLSASVNNALDEIYATSGFSGTLYPMPPRNFLFELSIRI